MRIGKPHDVPRRLTVAYVQNLVSRSHDPFKEVERLQGGAHAVIATSEDISRWNKDPWANNCLNARPDRLVRLESPINEGPHNLESTLHIYEE